MQTLWNYTSLADAYLKRPDYASSAIDALLGLAGAGPGSQACDIGAGVAHLTLELARRGLAVTAVEPNDAMRANGMARTEHLSNVTWREGVGENTGCETGRFQLVTFGSSFNVCDRPAALRESQRLLVPGGWFACLWNHRDLDDPIQRGIEETIQARIPGYTYGTRREDQTQVIQDSGLFGPVQRIEGRVLHQQSLADCIEAWRSHATLERQAGEAFPELVQAIEEYLRGLERETIEIPYTTRLWAAARL